MNVLVFQLAQSAAELEKERAFRNGMIWLGILFVFVLVGGIILLYVRARYRKQMEPPTEDFGFTLADLKKLRDRGELSDAEYEVARNRMVLKLKKQVGDPTADFRRERNPPAADADGTQV